MTLTAPKPMNQARRKPTASFSLPNDQIERMRELAWARGVSLSQVARDALDLAFATWEHAGEHDEGHAAERQSRLPARWPRELRRSAARHGVKSAEPTD